MNKHTPIKTVKVYYDSPDYAEGLMADIANDWLDWQQGETTEKQIDALNESGRDYFMDSDIPNLIEFQGFTMDEISHYTLFHVTGITTLNS